MDIRALTIPQLEQRFSILRDESDDLHDRYYRANKRGGVPLPEWSDRLDELLILMREVQDELDRRESLKAKDDLKALQSKHKKLSRDKKILEQRVKELEDHVEELTGKSNKVQDENEKLRDELSGAAFDNNRVKASLTKVRAELDQLRKDHTSALMKIEELEDPLELCK